MKLMCNFWCMSHTQRDYYYWVPPRRTFESIFSSSDCLKSGLLKRSNFLNASLGFGVTSSLVSALGGELLRLLLVLKLVDEREGLKLLLPLMLNLLVTISFKLDRMSDCQTIV